MTPKTWLDQPDEVEKAEIKLSFHTPNVGIIEVRACEESNPLNEIERWTHRTFYVSAGTLFGSTTLLAFGTDAMLGAVNALANKRKKPIDVPTGCEVVSDLVPKTKTAAASG